MICSNFDHLSFFPFFNSIGRAPLILQVMIIFGWYCNPPLVPTTLSLPSSIEEFDFLYGEFDKISRGRRIIYYDEGIDFWFMCMSVISVGNIFCIYGLTKVAMIFKECQMLSLIHCMLSLMVLLRVKSKYFVLLQTGSTKSFK